MGRTIRYGLLWGKSIRGSGFEISKAPEHSQCALFLCFLLEDPDVSSQMILPPGLHYAIVGSIRANEMFSFVSFLGYGVSSQQWKF